MLHVDTEWAYKHSIFNISVSSKGAGKKKTEMVIIVAVHEMDFKAVK